MSSAIATQELRYRVTACKRVTIINNAGSAMRARESSTLGLGLLAVAWLAGCALKPVEAPPAPSHDECDAPNPLHIVSTSSLEREVDPEIESLLALPAVDPRLTRVNRQMYQSLYALNAEIRQEQKIAACKRVPLNDPALQTQSGAGANRGLHDGSAMSPDPVPSAAFAANSSSAPSAITTSSAGIATIPSPASLASAGDGGSQASLLRKSNASANGAAGNGASAPKIIPGSDDDIVARRLRNAAEAETDPALRAKLWKEYMDYQRGTAAAK